MASGKVTSGVQRRDEYVQFSGINKKIVICDQQLKAKYKYFDKYMFAPGVTVVRGWYNALESLITVVQLDARVHRGNGTPRCAWCGTCQGRAKTLRGVRGVAHVRAGPRWCDT